jgi:hypothetical protein
VILFVAAAMVFGWKTFNGKMRKYFKTKLSDQKKNRKPERQPPNLVVQSPPPTLECATGESLSGNMRKYLGAKFSAKKDRKKARQPCKIPVCANGETLDFENFKINIRPPRPETPPLKEPASCAKKREMTLLILEGKVAPPPPSPFLPLPPGLI